MYKSKYIFGQMVKYKGEVHKVVEIWFSIDGVLYRLSNMREWIRENELMQ